MAVQTMGSTSADSKEGAIAASSTQDSFPVDHDQRWTLQRWSERPHREERKFCLGGERVTHSIPPLIQELVLVYGIMLAVCEQPEGTSEKKA